LAYLLTVGAVHNDRAYRSQILPPVWDFVGISPDRADDYPVVSSERRLAANIDDDRCDSRTDRPVQILSRDRSRL
jgi:hypothetical protein